MMSDKMLFAGKPEQIKSIIKQRHSDNNDLLIYHHLGLGDHIALSGLVREIIKEDKPDNVYMACLNYNSYNVERLYSDIPNFHVVDAGGHLGFYDEPMEKWIVANAPNKTIKIGHQDWGRIEGSWDGYVDTKVYIAAGYDINLRWDGFYYERDLDEEERVFQKLNPNDEEYCFIHDPGNNQHISDGKWRGVIKDETVQHASTRNNLKLIRNDISIPIINLGLVLERASELHLMESSIRCLIEGLDTTNVRHFHHRYIKDSYCLDNGTMKCWMVIEEPDLNIFKTSILNGPAQIEYYNRHGKFSENLRATGFYTPTWG